MSDSYYGHPIVKPHVWTPYVPIYFWIGGTAGAAAVQTVISRLRGNEPLAIVEKRIALASAVISPVLLIVDLGVPKRFLNMMRVFKPTSPMSVGSWVLSAFGTFAGASTLAELLGRKRLAAALDVATAAFGPALATYTGVLLGDTATPVWQAARTDLPRMFAASGIAGAGALGVLFTPSAFAVPARRLMIGGAIGMVRTSSTMERRLGKLLSEPYRTGRSGSLQKSASTFALAGAFIGFMAGRNRVVNAVAAVLVIAGGVCERFAVFEAGTASAADPKYTVEPQRARLSLPQDGSLESGPAQSAVQPASA